MTQGFRIWLFLGVFSALAAIAFLLLLLTADALQVTSGMVMLGVFALSMLYITWVLRSGRYTDPTEQPDAVAEVGPEHIFPPSWAPPLLALGIALFVCGVRFTPVLLAVGGVIIVLTLFSWVVQRVDLARLLHGQHPELADAPEPAGRPAAATPGDREPRAREFGSPQLGDDHA